MGQEMSCGFQNSPFLDLILNQQHSVPTLKALPLKRTNFRSTGTMRHVDWVTAHQLTLRSILKIGSTTFFN
jgi:hypothetical protein